ncbi:MAG: hydantoinase/oxoprolinase family protein [Candidatus Tectomicrobia bacterium]|uniref:Hydantoinase/oxoprolinase family protein n=1 Tax=Tectimicrobiota bacterium TaxID=2528274 RepID=A0A932ZUE9_UNCTE|nr:hydantoinase/oxoprolinase family protein [Candidatus Tectomicrobia bacterium]
MFSIGVDIGGTFTDVAVVEEGRERAVAGKALTTPEDFLQGVLDALEDAAGQMGLPLRGLLQDAQLLAHGTTITSNVLWTRSGPPVGLLATRGFADQILIMRGIGRVAGLSLAERRHYRTTDKPEPLVPRKRIRELAERVDSAGAALVPLDEAEARAQIRDLTEREGIEALAVGLLWSFRNPAHERQVAALAGREFPGLRVSLSSEVSGRLGEYERTATAVLNAYVGGAMEGYLERLTQRLAQEGLRRPPLIVQSNGGLTPAGEVIPVRTIESGPAAGVVGAARLAGELGRPNLIATDVGGTTFKVALIQEGRWELAAETVLTQYHVHVPMVDVVSIGAGGGSIAWEDEGRLRVGPRSAGAAPGPACYGKGGSEPTVTDADLLLGTLNPRNFLGGRIPLDVEAARGAFARGIAPQFFGGDPVRAAAGVREIINAQMADLIRRETLERGRDPGDFALIAYGGAGPVHAHAYAAEAGIAGIIVPYQATVLSAYGAAAGGVRYTLERSLSVRLPGGAEEAARAFAGLEAEGNGRLERAHVPPQERRFDRWVAMRWRRQVHSLAVAFPPGPVTEESLAGAAADFAAEYAARYGEGSAYTEAGVEITRFWINALGPSLAAVRTPLPASEAAARPRGTRPVHWGGAFIETAVYDGPSLAAGAAVEGPAVIEHPGTAIALPPGARAMVDAAGHTHIRLEAAARRGGEGA